MVRVKCFFSWLWYFMTDGLYRMLGYFIASAVIWNVFISRADDHKNLLEIGNVVYVFFAVLGCAVGIFAAMIFSSENNEDHFRLAPDDTERPFVSAAIAELLKAVVSVWISVYTSLLLAKGIELVSMHKLAIMAICYVALYFSVGLFAGSVTKNPFLRIAFCVLYFHVSMGLTYLIFVDSKLEWLEKFRYPFLLNAPLFSYDMYVSHGCVLHFYIDKDIILVGTRGFFFLSFSQFAGLMLTACLFFVAAILKYKHKKGVEL